MQRWLDNAINIDINRDKQQHTDKCVYDFSNSTSCFPAAEECVIYETVEPSPQNRCEIKQASASLCLHEHIVIVTESAKEELPKTTQHRDPDISAYYTPFTWLHCGADPNVNSRGTDKENVVHIHSKIISH